MIDKVIELYKEKTKKDCYRFEVEKHIAPGIMDDKIGGIPYLPVGEEYPLDKDNNPMILLVQINLENIKLENYPQEGILEIFIDRECSWPCDYKIKYFRQITEYRKDLAQTDSDNGVYKKPLKIKLIKDIEHMPMSDYRSFGVMVEIIKEIANVEIKDLSDLEEFFFDYDSDIFGEMEELNIFPGNLAGYADYTQEDPRPLMENGEKMECLIKIDSNLKNGIMIGDGGIIFSFISPEDAKSGNFENAIVDWDCF